MFCSDLVYSHNTYMVTELNKYKIKHKAFKHGNNQRES